MGKETFTKHFQGLLAEILVTSVLQGYMSGAEHAQGECDAQVWEESSVPSMYHEGSGGWESMDSEPWTCPNPLIHSWF